MQNDECSTQPLINHLSEILEIFLFCSSKFAQSAAGLKYILRATLSLGFGQVQSSCADEDRRQREVDPFNHNKAALVFLSIVEMHASPSYLKGSLRMCQNRQQQHLLLMQS